MTVSATAQQLNTEDAKVRHVIDASQAGICAAADHLALMTVPGVAVTTDLASRTSRRDRYSANARVYNPATVMAV